MTREEIQELVRETIRRELTLTINEVNNYGGSYHISYQLCLGDETIVNDICYMSYTDA